jgi:hypothetical protein
MENVFDAKTMILLLLLFIAQHTSAGPVTVSMSSAAVMAGSSSYTLNPLIIVVPLISFAVVLLIMSLCCCLCRGRNNPSRPTARPTHWRYSNPIRMHYLGPHGTGHTQLVGLANPKPPPAYSPSISSPSSNHRGHTGSPASKHLGLVGNPWETGHSHVEATAGALLEPPSPLISRAGSPSLQIWTPPLSPIHSSSRFDR